MLTRKERPETQFRSTFGNLPVPGARAGALVSLALAVIAGMALPVSRPFPLGTVGLVVGSILQWKPSR